MCIYRCNFRDLLKLAALNLSIIGPCLLDQVLGIFTQPSPVIRDVCMRKVHFNTFSKHNGENPPSL